MRVLIQSRVEPNAGTSGLETQMLKTAAALRARGVEVDLRTDPEGDVSAYDLVHLMCLPDAPAALRGWLNAQGAKGKPFAQFADPSASQGAKDKPVVVTPIYWNLRRFETEGRALLREWTPQLIDEAEAGQAARALVAQIEQVGRQVTSAALRVVYRGAAVLTPSSALEGEQLVRDFGVEPRALRVAYNGADPRFGQASADPFIARYGWRDFVLCAGRIDPRKNQYSLLRALAQDAVPLVLIGGTTSPEYLAACRSIAGAQTHFLPALSEAQIAEADAAARVHVLVTWGEVASLAALEAGLAGCNLVMTEDSSAREYFGEHAWYCDPGDRDSIRRAVLGAWHAPRGRAREFIRATYAWERTAEAICEAYEEALAVRRPDYDPQPDLARLAQLQAVLIPLQEQYSELLWKDKTASQEYARRLANGRVMRLLNRLGGAARRQS